LATTGADGRRQPGRLRRWALATAGAVAVAGAFASCTPSAPPAPPPPEPAPPQPHGPKPVPAPAPRPEPPPPPQGPPAPPAPDIEAPAGLGPELRVGLVVGAAAVTIGGEGPSLVISADSVIVATLEAGGAWRVGARGPGLALTRPDGATLLSRTAVTVLAAEPGAPVVVNGRPYRGAAEISRDPAGVTAVNRVGLEEYLRGVVSGEMGRRRPDEAEALRAQAIVSRTYALRNRGRWRARGFDLYATVADQVYGGAALETPEGDAAVQATRGEVVTWGGALINAFFYSTCGGRTAEGTEVFRAADRPYLRSVSDAGPDGTAYCSVSPRYRWREEWDAELLRATLRSTLPEAAGVEAGAVREVRDVRVTARTGSGRVGQVAIALDRSEVRVVGPAVRRVLRTAAGEPLRSAAFTLAAAGAGHVVTRLVAEGGGAGHGVGFCQWGAVGRARAGQRYRDILQAYYPGTLLERLY
jgi:stage II sporulation protein D